MHTSYSEGFFPSYIIHGEHTNYPPPGLSRKVVNPKLARKSGGEPLNPPPRLGDAESLTADAVDEGRGRILAFAGAKPIVEEEVEQGDVVRHVGVAEAWRPSGTVESHGRS